MSDDGDGRAAPVDGSKFEREWRWVILALAGFGILAAVLYGGQFGSKTFLRVAGVSAVVAGSAALVGGVLASSSASRSPARIRSRPTRPGTVRTPASSKFPTG